jgi:hypothetical protein
VVWSEPTIGCLFVCLFVGANKGNVKLSLSYLNRGGPVQTVHQMTGVLVVDGALAAVPEMMTTMTMTMTMTSRMTMSCWLQFQMCVQRRKKRV